ncbi:MAG: hypothetical protein WBA99_15330 [Nodosilinea sp.]
MAKAQNAHYKRTLTERFNTETGRGAMTAASDMAPAANLAFPSGSSSGGST